MQNKLSKICMHWTAGTGIANREDKKHYHFIVENSGRIVAGDYKPEANINCQDGHYAAHCGGGNTGTIGVALAGMLNFDGKTKTTSYPISEIQLENFIQKIAELSMQYSIPINSGQIFTHYEFGQANRNSSSFGKQDITYLHPKPSLGPGQVGEYLRDQIRKKVLEIQSAAKGKL